MKKILLAAVSVMILATGAATADRDDWRGREAWHWRDDRGTWHADHDRYWHPGWRYGAWAPRERFFAELRRHNYARWDGEPYWYRGRYVIRTYNRRGEVVFVELNPYNGAFIGEIRF